MKSIKQYMIIFMAVLALSSCEKDGDMIILKGHEASELTASETSVVLSKDNDDEPVLSLSWSGSTLSVTDESMGVPSGVPVFRLQASASEDFQSIVELEPDFSYYTFSGAKLNTWAKDAGLEPDVASPLYFRVQSQLGENIAPIFSNVVSVNVTPYVIDMSQLFLISTDKSDTLGILYSQDWNGEYSGFVQATSWMNFYFLEGDDTLWGNDSDPGTAFELSNDEATMWNCWFPGNGGAYFVTMSTNEFTWSATWLPEIVATGDLEENDTLSYYKSFDQWAGLIDPSTENAQITLYCDGLFYNVSTGTNDVDAIATTLYFADAGSGLLAIAESPGTFTIPTAETHTLILDFSDPTQWTFSLTEGNHLPQEEEEIPYLYLPGSKDGETGGGWTFDNYIPQVNDTLYAGVVYVNSQWGFQMFTAADWGADYYTMGETEGSLVKNGDGNIPAPEPGFFLITADLKNLTYSLIPLGDEIYLSGLNDVWDFNTSIPKTGDGVYSGSIVVTTPSTYGFRIYPEVDNWNDYFGGADGSLYFLGSSLTDDSQVGTYTLTIDLINMTYQMTLN
ncbi:DUF5114 domain-containing protein [Thermophagus xiamenensis]|uniref:SusE outer membrane protein n=1 Tax=Thermophagus xiamenensis TaxID=385682 RepID=A0A1I2CJU4_9BACT|nr:DUF5114 domain-containing protein [Thermophagus xiamenensis]SFE68422.1 protein of unknown function [Thermophagus xiamenensis]